MIAAVLLTTLVGLATPAAAQSPSQVVDALANQVVTVLKNSALDAQQKRTEIQHIAYGAIDFPTLSKLVLARNWPKFSPGQRGQFEQEFKEHLSMTYGRNVDNYKNEKVAILGERPEARNDVTVQTKILRGGSDDVVVDYRLRENEGQWKIIDVIIEGVSLVSNFRSQFQDIVANGGPDRLLELLKEKNAAGEPLQKPQEK
ncbi:MAG TPA: ABC transporter substrate-binding protein [Candidatus Dormibacteraeota bacterium]|nr:ABC transporter substrate-binding protein [Candidatus Dormibacteraeota bacterium]